MQLPGYDAWLEAPYVDAARREAAEEAVITKLGLTDEEAEEFDFDTYWADLADDHNDPEPPDGWDHDPRDNKPGE